MALVAPPVDSATPEPDLGPLAWVLDELRKSLDAANMALRRFVRDAELSRGSDIAALDASHLRIARQQLHQAVGALEMVGFEVPARMLRATEALVQKFVQKPEFCSDEAALCVERASFALTDYLQATLKGRNFSSVQLFPQYRDVLNLNGSDRVHPADLWTYEWRWRDVPVPAGTLPLSYDSTVRSRVDGLVLNVVKTGQPVACGAMRDISMGFAAHQQDVNPRVFWMLSAAFFEALALGLCPADLYTKRAASHVLLQFRTLTRGPTDISEQLVRDLLFFCSQAQLPVDHTAPALQAVQQVYALRSEPKVDYERRQFGRYDPAVLTQAIKRVATAAETWSLLSGGDLGRMKAAADQFALVADSVVKLHPENREFAMALTRAMEQVARSGAVPQAAVAMEVATAVLYLQAAYDDMDPDSGQTVERGNRLAQRIDHVMDGGQPEPLDPWMQELYRRVSDRQVMGSVVDELRTSLSEVEKALDTYFRSPDEKLPLQEVPGRLSQMRGVFSVLGLEQAAVGALRMRDSVERLLVDAFDDSLERARTFERLGNSLGSLGFLIDMLSYQREMAKKLFIYDDSSGEFRSVMGVHKAPAAAPAEPDETGYVASAPAEVPQPSPDQAPAALPSATVLPAPAQALAAAASTAPKDLEQEDDDQELRSIFLEEATEVIKSGLDTIDALQARRDDLALQTVLRRAFHTLKGSSRMVGLTQFGEAAWALEQLLNAWLPQQRPITEDMLTLTRQAMDGFGDWLRAIADGQDTAWTAQPFVQAADRLRLDEVFQPITLLAATVPADLAEGSRQDLPAPVPAAAAAPQTELVKDFAATMIHDFVDTRVDSRLPSLLGNFDDLGVTPVSDDPLAPLPSRFDVVVSQPPQAVDRDEPMPESQADESVKVIGPLRIGIALYNVFLNEADEWSRRLLTELSEWSLELKHPVPEATVAWAHSLAGSSATVGFSALSELTRALEHAMEHTRLGAEAQSTQAQLFVAVAEDVRRLLHQFAAGFLKEPAPDLLEALHDLLATDVSTVVIAPTVAPPEQINATDMLDVDLFSVFEEEAQDLMPRLGAALRHWYERPDNLDARQEALRLLHTLKGSARLAGAMRLGEMAHRAESAVQAIDAQAAESAMLEPLLGRFDAMASCFDQLRATPLEARVLPEVSVPIEAAPGLDASGAPAPARPLPFDPDQKVSVWAAPVASVPVAVPSAVPAQRTSVQTIRVKSQLIDRMVDQAGEVMISRARLETRLGQLRGSLGELTNSLERLRTQLRDVEIQSESQMQSRQAQTRDAAQTFDPLEFDRFTRMQELTRMMAESVNDVATLQRNLQQTVAGVEDDLVAQARQTRELQRFLLRTRMVEFNSISERLFGVVRQACKDFGKQVKLEVTGGALELDRGVLDRVVGSFEHLLRNAVGHGIESTSVRQAAGKSATGQISVHVEQQSNDVAVVFSDDGAGLNLERIRQKAIERGQVSANQELTDAEVANLIFSSGLSTASEVSEMAGRGIGMDVVRSEVNGLGGRIELSTQPGRGTQFKLVVPLTTAVNQIVLFRIGELVMGVPASLVELVRRVPHADLDAAYTRGEFDYNGELLPFYWAGALLQMSARSAEARDKTAAVGIFRSAGQHVAVHVDEVLGNQEVVVKNLGPQLARLPGLAGMSMLASGAVVLIYNMVALSVAYGDRARAVMGSHDVSNVQQKPVTEVNQVPVVLVVDDSVTVRRVTQRLLKREGFRVALAADGLQALEQLQIEKPSVVLTDIEMPRMDGFDLVRNIRADAALQDLPIIMITSRIAEKHREYARELKVDHYLGKPYPEDELIALVRGYCGVAAAVA